MDCTVQLIWIQLQHHRPLHCPHPDPRQHQQRIPRLAQIHASKSSVGKLLRRDRLSQGRLSSHDICRCDLDNEVSLLYLDQRPLPLILTIPNSGYDAPFHLSEECSNANIAAPRAIVLTSGVGGLFGWFLQLVVAYTVIDIDAVLDSDLGQPWASYLLQVLPQKTALAALSLTIIAAFSMGQGCMVAASRVTFAYARDDCFPCSWWIQRVNRHTRTPVNAVWFNTAIGIIMTLLIFGGELAAGALFSIAAVAAFVAFTIPIFIRVFFVGNRFRPGPWHLGKASMPIGVCACAFVALMVPILMLPSVTGSDLDASGMNWTCLVWGAPMLMVTIWWFVDAHKWFKGPKVSRDFLTR